MAEVYIHSAVSRMIVKTLLVFYTKVVEQCHAWANSNGYHYLMWWLGSGDHGVVTMDAIIARVTSTDHNELSTRCFNQLWQIDKGSGRRGKSVDSRGRYLVIYLRWPSKIRLCRRWRTS